MRRLIHDGLQRAEAKLEEVDADSLVSFMLRQAEDALLFAMANLSRHLKVDPEDSLRGANAKFTRRFKYIEAALATQGRSVEDASLEEMETLWVEAKRAEHP